MTLKNRFSMQIENLRRTDFYCYIFFQWENVQNVVIAVTTKKNNESDAVKPRNKFRARLFVVLFTNSDFCLVTFSIFSGFSSDRNVVKRLQN